MPHQATDGGATSDAGESEHETGSVARQAAMQPCLACERAFPLTPANHDGYGPVCPNCGCLI